MLVFSFVSCDSLEEPQNNNQGGAGAEEEISDLFKETISEYVVVTSRENFDVAEKFVQNFKKTTDILLDMKYDDSIVEEKEIMFGKSDRYDGKVPYFCGYDVKTMNGKIYIAASDKNELFAGSNEVINNIKRIVSEEGNLLNFSLSGATDEILKGVPEFAGKTPILFDIGGGSEAIYMANCTENDFNSYSDLLEQNGFVEYQSNTIVDNRYAIYTSDVLTINLTYIAEESKLIVASERKGALPDVDTNYQESTTTQLTQIQLVQQGNIDGMSYVLRVADGRFICIDGGWHESRSRQAEKFLNTLESQTPAGQKPVIALWIITHPHEDHIGMFTDFIAKYNDKVEISKIAYDIGAYEYILNGDGAYLLQNNAIGYINRMMDNIERYIPNVPILKIHGGQKFKIADAEIEILYTLSDMLPNTCANLQMNSTSVVFTITVDNNKIMFLGDALPVECDALVKMYGNYLKSDMMQLAHHGYNGATKEIYQYINPAVALWPSNPMAIESNSNYDYNKWLIENDSCKEIIVSGYGDYIFELPYVSTNVDLTNKFINKV